MLPLFDQENCRMQYHSPPVGAVVDQVHPERGDEGRKAARGGHETDLENSPVVGMTKSSSCRTGEFSWADAPGEEPTSPVDRQQSDS